MEAMKHVVAINGSPRKAATHRLLIEAADLLEARQIQVTMINLGDYQIDDCTGCEIWVVFKPNTCATDTHWTLLSWILNTTLDTLDAKWTLLWP